MNKIINDLKPKCDTCHLLSLNTNMTTFYGGQDVVERHIKLTCKNMAVCKMYEEYYRDEFSEE